MNRLVSLSDLCNLTEDGGRGGNGCLLTTCYLQEKGQAFVWLFILFYADLLDT